MRSARRGLAERSSSSTDGDGGASSGRPAPSTDRVAHRLRRSHSGRGLGRRGVGRPALAGRAHAGARARRAPRARSARRPRRPLLPLVRAYWTLPCIVLVMYEYMYIALH